jgi:serpin B
MRMRQTSSAPALVLAVLLAGCAGGSTPAPAPEPPRATPPADPAPPSSAIVASAAPAATNGNSAPDAGAPNDPGIDHQADVKAANGFTARLYARVKKTPGNLMISGTSVRHALEIAYLGARAETAREMSVALELPAEPAKAAALAKAEAASWQEARGKSELFVANRLWSDKAFPLKSDFTSLADATFGAAAEQVDFMHAPDVARRTVNTWVAEKTAQKIPDLLPEGSIDKRTRVIVTNAIYFKGKWASPFPNAATKDEPFKGAKTANVPMMHTTSSHRFAQVGNVKVVEMRYDTSQLGMLVVLPDETAGLAKLEESLSADLFETWTKAISMQRVAITLPKFGFKWGSPLASPLQELGMKSAFSPKADLSGIADVPSGERLQVSQVMHKTWVAVDELGTEAAASTGLTMSTTSLPMGPIADFKADHPFLFFVYDAKKGRILFAGRVTDPKG